MDKDVLLDLIKRSNHNIDDFFNSNGKIFKDENLKEKLPTLNDSQKIDLLLSDGKLIKRPILDFGKDVYLGFNKQTIASIEANLK